MKCYQKTLAIGMALALVQSGFAAHKLKSSKETPQNAAMPSCDDTCPPKVEEDPCRKKQVPTGPCAPCTPVCFEKGTPTSSKCTPCGFNEWAAVQTSCSWEFFTTGSFIYWLASQEQLVVAAPRGLTLPNTQSKTNGNILVAKTEFSPGFKVGAGMSGGEDHWVFYGEYTRLHAQTHVSKRAPTPAPGFGNVGIWQNYWFAQQTNFSLQTAFKWTYKIDIGDILISRPFYEGPNLVVKPYAGLRGMWFNEKAKATESQVVYSSGPLISQIEGISHTSSNSWGIGPRLGIDGNCLLGKGFRLEANSNLALLYTRYTQCYHSENNINYPVQAGATGTQSALKDYGAIRPSAGCALGFGWGNYFNQQNFFFDLSASYELNVFWKLSALNTLGADTTEFADLFLQGLTASARFDF